MSDHNKKLADMIILSREKEEFKKMKTIMKKTLCLLIGLFILFSINCYAGETLTAQQKKAEEWFKKAERTDTLILKI